MKSKWAVSIIAILAGFLLAANAMAVSISDSMNPSGEEDLFQIWNTLFNDGQTSSNDLFTSYGVPDGSDWYWEDMGGSVHATVRYAGFGQALGYRYDGQFEWLRDPIDPGYTTGNRTSIDVPGGGPFVWVERANGYLWSSNSDQYGPYDDHFVAFRVPDELVWNYNDQWEPDLGNMVYMIAFEDMPGLGDHDYNDLVAIVDMVKPVPEPATMLLLGVGLLGLAGISGRKFLKR